MINNNLESFSVENYLSSVFPAATYQMIRDRMYVLVHGVEIDLNLPVLFVYQNFAYMDGHLYITLYMTK